MFPEKDIRRIKEILLQKKQTVAVAESVTAGLLQAAMASAEEAVDFFQGGICVYNLGQKCRHLHINPIKALACNCVSGEIACDMANQVTGLFVSDWGIGITGYATPVPESGDKLYAFISISFRGKEVVTKKITGSKESGLETQLGYVRKALSGFLKIITSGETERSDPHRQEVPK